MKVIRLDKPDNWQRVFLIATCLGTQSCGRPPVSPSATATLVFPQRATDQMIWPQNQTWIWSVNRLDKPEGGNSVSLVVRSVRERFQGDNPAIGSRIISKDASQSEVSPGTLVGGATVPFQVGVQLIDLGTAAIPASDALRPLRLLLRLKEGPSEMEGGSEIHRVGEQCVLEGNSVAGNSIHHNAEWSNGELHLMNLFVRTKDELITYDVVVVTSEPQ
jgi:hypothetical protein